MRIADTPEYLQYLANHPDIAANVDVSELFTRSIVYQCEGAAICFVRLPDGIFEAHTQALKTARGAKVRELIRFALDDIFNNQGAEKVTSYAFKNNPAAKKLALEFLNPEGEDDNAFYFGIDKGGYLCL